MASSAVHTGMEQHSQTEEAHSSSNRRPLDDELVQKPKKRSLPLEIPVLLLFLCWNLTGTVFQNQILFQTCTVSLGYNETDCLQLGRGDESEFLKVKFARKTSQLIQKVNLQSFFAFKLQKLEKIVESYATTILMFRAILENIVPAIFSLFIGPWSDKYGRKPVLLCTFTGRSESETWFITKFKTYRIVNIFRLFLCIFVKWRDLIYVIVCPGQSMVLLAIIHPDFIKWWHLRPYYRSFLLHDRFE